VGIIPEIVGSVTIERLSSTPTEATITSILAEFVGVEVQIRLRWPKSPGGDIP
jgi:hypothetical protein